MTSSDCTVWGTTEEGTQRGPQKNSGTFAALAHVELDELGMAEQLLGELVASGMPTLRIVDELKGHLTE
ncbi:MAG: hypothetical protein GY711_26010 [bacterium]|nr:hypothetical protein [bacterium]